MKSRISRLSLIALIAATSACVTINPDVVSRGDRYVALGSSFAAGPGLGQIKPDAPARCQRSALNYPTLLANRLGLTLEDASCGGATTAHILGPWDELPAQIDAVTSDTRLITITIGGNDIGYVRNLMAASCDPVAGFVFQGQRRDCFPKTMPQAADYAQLDASLRRLVAALQERAPEAQIIFVQYLRLVDDANCAALGLDADELIALRNVGERLATVTQRVADDTGVEVLPADQLSRGHTPCDAQPFAVGARVDAPGNPGAPWHPNAAGMRAVADALAEMTRR